ncbi:lytic transglycosylase [Clostridia bacterium]|nr:lytic transglycosylase [Clostridia bacterium]
MKKIRASAKLLFLLFVVLFVGRLALRVGYPLAYMDIINENAVKYNIDPYFVVSVIHAESRFAPEATSSKDAKGLMQMREETAVWCAEQVGLQDFAAERIYEPSINIVLGVWYLDHLLERYGGDKKLCLAAYNAGMGNVDRWLADGRYSADGLTLREVPYPETARYITKVLNNYAIYKMIY